jgi:hypothetical protein
MSAVALFSTREAQARAFWLAAGILVALKLALVSGVSIEAVYGPHDDSLYIERALRFLNGEAFGPYDSSTLLKYPGISLWLAAMRWLGVPFLLSVNLVYVAGGAYVVAGLVRVGVGRWIALLTFALWLFNPITLGYEWVRVIREPLGTGLYAVMAGAMLHIVAGLERRYAPWPHLAIFTPVFAFTLYLREDDRLLWGMLLLFVAALVYQAVCYRPLPRRLTVFVIAVALAPAALAKTYEYSLRSFVKAHYGQPILHDMGEGEFPRLLAAIRSIDSAKDNRLVMVTQEALGKLRTAVPGLRPVIDRLPPPGPGTFSCRMHGVCTEWANGWMPIWIKDAAYLAGLTPTLPAAQDYFRRMREEIERACEHGALRCTPKGDGLVAPMELRWTRALVGEAWALIKMVLVPDPYLRRVSYLTYDMPPEIAAAFRFVTMSKDLSSDRYAWPAVSLFQTIAALLLLGAFATLLQRLWNYDRVPLDPLALVSAVVGLYFLARLAVLCYLTVFMGPLVPRFVFSTYAVGLLLALPLVAQGVIAWRRSKAAEGSR